MRTTTTEALNQAEQPLSDAALVECVQVSRGFGPRAEVAAVRSVSCLIGRRTRVALTGASGSGKSTLLHLMAGLDVSTSGEVRWPGLAGPPYERPGIHRPAERPNWVRPGRCRPSR